MNKHFYEKRLLFKGAAFLFSGISTALAANWPLAFTFAYQKKGKE